MKIIEKLKGSSAPIFSFEFFPPKTEETMAELYGTLLEVKKLNPAYISVTYPSGGGARDKTIQIVERAKNEIGIESMAHLACVGHSKAEVKAILDELAQKGIENVIALRGDPLKGEASFKAHPEGFKHASELTAFIRSSYSFCIAVAGYPEGHLESSGKEEDWNHLKEKVDAGGDFIITQLFFDNRDFFTFEGRMREKGVTAPIIPGIMPITNVSQILRFSRTCGAKIPQSMVSELEAIQDDSDAVHEYGIAFATRQCTELIAHGVPGIHFYTLNKSKSSLRIVENLRKEISCTPAKLSSSAL